MARIFISYRAADTGPYANLLAARLRDRFGFDSIFRDRNAIGPGEEFVDEIRTELAGSDLVLVLIGKGWLSAAGPDGVLRLSLANDFVRREIAMALAGDKIVVPVLFDGSQMPRAEQLPEDLRKLIWRSPYDINGKYFERDADDLARNLEQTLAERAEKQSASEIRARAVRGTGRQFLIMTFAWFAITVGSSVAPVVPSLFWLFPATMTVASYFKYLASNSGGSYTAT